MARGDAMEKVWKQIVLATTLGILVPQLVLAAGEGRGSPGEVEAFGSAGPSRKPEKL